MLKIKLLALQVFMAAVERLPLPDSWFSWAFNTYEDLATEAEVRDEIEALSAATNCSSSVMLAEAWREYLANHRDEFDADLKHGAELLSSGTHDDLVAWVNEDVDRLAAQDAASVRS